MALTCHLCRDSIEQTADMVADMEAVITHLREVHDMPDAERWPDGGLVYTEDFDPEFGP